MLEFAGDCFGYGCGREDDLLHGVENVNEESCVDGGTKVKSVCHNLRCYVESSSTSVVVQRNYNMRQRLADEPARRLKLRGLSSHQLALHKFRVLAPLLREDRTM